MPNAARVYADSAGGTLIGLKSIDVFVNGFPWELVGDKVASHGLPPHSPPPSMVKGSGDVFVKYTPVCRAGDSASCGHKALSGSGTVFANG